MGFFDDIKARIFGAPAAAPAAAPVTPASPAPNAAPAPAAPAPAPQAAPTTTVAQASQPAAAPAPGAAAPASAPVDVGAIMDAAVAKSGQQLNWKTSIVDLMKALGLDSSLTARKEMADELGYTGDKNDSATMNIWLHKQVLAKLAANGGKVPADLLD